MKSESDKPDPILFATAARGTEGAVRDELRELGFRSVRADRGGVHFGRTLEEGFRAALELRTALRVLCRLSSFPAPSEAALYEGVAAIDWQPYLTERHTLAVRAYCRDSELTHSQFIAQKTKDAIVDQLRARLGARPSVDLDDPDVTLFVHLVRDHATVYLDLAGASLHRRGWRENAMAAPLKESLAAAILRLSGWDRDSPLVDPMCGSGTLAIEAALAARQIAPGLARERFGFERWACHGDAAKKRMTSLRLQTHAKIRKEQPRIVGSDIDVAALTVARDNAAAAGVNVEWRRASVRDLAPQDPPGVVVVNPPYGDRLDVPPELHRDMARAFERLSGHRVVILAGAPSVVREMRLRPVKSHAVWNGDIECRLLTYEVP